MTATLADEDVRKRLLTEFETTFLVEAGAGTGKTTVLVDRIVALVSGGMLTMDRLAAITFTEAAAAELRDRLRETLEKCAHEHMGTEAGKRCAAASTTIDLAAVQTIHAFAGSLLRTYPLEAQLPPGFAMLDEIQRDLEFDDRFRAWLYDEVPDERHPARRAAVRRALTLGMEPTELRDLATRLQDYRDLVDKHSAWQSPQIADPVATAHHWGQELVKLAPLVDDALVPSDKLVNELRGVRLIAQRMVEVAGADESLELLQRCAPRQVGSRNHWPDGMCQQIKQTFKDACAEITEVVDAHRQAALADLLHHLRDFTARYARERRERGQATFHDLLTWARDLLRDNPDVRRQAQAGFDYLFVDEFQDTDPLQVEIAWFLSSVPEQALELDWTKLQLAPGKLFLVGDPKQSIYRFRRADIGMYDDVKQRLRVGADGARLTQNFRSVERVVAWVNYHFGRDMQPEQRVQPAYVDLIARPGEDGFRELDGPFGVYRIGGLTDGTAAERWLLEATATARLARLIVQGPRPWRISDHGVVRDARYADVCVLLPSRTNLRRLEREFEKERVPLRMESGSLVLDTQEVRDLLSCLRAIDDPSDQVALVAALRSPAYGCSDLDLLAWVEGGGRLNYERPGSGSVELVAKAFASLMMSHGLRMDRSSAATTEALIRERMLAVQAYGHRYPRDAARRLRYVVAQARTLALSGHTTLRALCDWLEARQQETYYDPESPLAESDEDAVRFMTVHGSKGLEFPIVLLTGLGSATSRIGPRSVDFIPDYGRDGERMRVLNVRCGEFRTIAYDRDIEKKMYTAEKVRLLYVATTRARDHLVLCLYHGKDASDAARIAAFLADRPDLSSQLEVPAPVGTPIVMAEAVEQPGAQLSPAEHEHAEREWLRQREALILSLSAQQVIAPSSLAHEPAEPDAPQDFEDKVAIRRTNRGRGGSALGRAVHSVLQMIDLTTLENLDTLAEAAAADEGVHGRLARLKQHVRAAAASAPVQRALVGRYWREVPVGIALESGALIEGAVDLLYEWPDGSLTVVDYKTDQVSESEVQARALQYRSQGAAYACALEQAAGKPVASVELVFAALGGTVQTFFRQPDAGWESTEPSSTTPRVTDGSVLS
jgi:ATP-dependent helicase/nuclease subunit A